MKFNNAVKNLMSNINPQRKIFLKTCAEEIDRFKQYMFDNYSVEDVYIRESFYDNSNPYVDRVPLYIEMNYSDFCRMLDSKTLRSENLEIIIKTDEGTFSIYKDNLKIIKEVMENDQVFKL